jgi:hypothetical protein
MKLIEPTYKQNNFHQAMEEKIRPWLNLIEVENHPDINKKRTELCQIGKLLVTYFNEFSIKELRERPDFVISNGDIEIGLEHQIVVESNVKEKEGFFETICKHVEIDIATKTSLRNFAINLYFNKGVDRKLKSKPEITKIITDVVVEKVTNNQLLPNPYVEDIFLMKHNQISITANFGPFVQKKLEESDIIHAIKKKEKKVVDYRKNTVQNQWLVIVVGQVNESSFEVRTDFNLSNDSKFDRVFVFEDFNKQLFELM